MNQKEIIQELDNIKKRNKKVELEKAWETSLERKISVALITYIIVVIIMYFLDFENIFINALIPTIWYILSTIGVNPMKNIYIRKKKWNYENRI